MMYGKFTENETGVVCDVQSVFQWEGCPMMVVVTYPVHGKQYGLTVDVFQLHFTMVSPQELQARAFGAVDERPTQQQLELQKKEEDDHGTLSSPPDGEPSGGNVHAEPTALRLVHAALES